MKYCKENIMNYWGCCESYPMRNYVTKAELEEALENISGDCDCDLSGITAQIEALQGSIVSLGDKVFTLEETMPQKANVSALTAIWEAISGLTARVEALESGSTPTPDPSSGDTGVTTDKKLVVTISGGTTYELDCDSDEHLDDTQVKGTDATYFMYQTAVVGDCITIIGNSAFRNCFNMSQITLPSGITEIHNYAFSTSYIDNPVTHLDVYINTEVPPTLIDDNEGFNGFFPIDCTIYVPNASVSAYQTAWSEYANIIQGMDATNGYGGGSGGIGD